MFTYDVLTFNREDSDAGDLFGTKCNTVEEKYRLLEGRDKVLRARIPKAKVRVEEATKLFGTCQDMCPEKERLMRQYQRQLTGFEMLENATGEYLVDHTKAVKAYSRSSADQEEPLPHDLRPGPVLEMTMDYLLHNIVPLADEDEDILGDWYTFLWDRTRSIRKDITQQQLTDHLVVGLLEKCARLHIHCSSRLCELEVHNFDPKLNDENLMKCLQSLEHMYDDLRRRGIDCPNEPEFRAYQIMMNLMEGNILFAVQQWPEWILKSNEIQIAIKLHHFMFTKNFVGFFNVVKSQRYMVSCILHRYFYHMRSQGLLRLCKSGSKAPGQLILSQTQRMLGYSATGLSLEFQQFCKLHGLKVDADNDRVHYPRKRFLTPEVRVINREYFLIESKLVSTVAEAINGGPLSENPLFTYHPHHSFDGNGYLQPGKICGDLSFDDFGEIPVVRPEDLSFDEEDYGVGEEYQEVEKEEEEVDGARSRSASPVKADTNFSNPFQSSNPFSGNKFSFGGGTAAGAGSSFSGFGNQAGFSFSKPSFTFGGTPAVFGQTSSATPISVKENKRQERLKEIESVCRDEADEFIRKMVEDEVTTLADGLMKQFKLERVLQKRLQMKDQIRTRLCEESLDKLLIPVIRSIVVGQIKRHQEVQKRSEQVAESWLDKKADSLIHLICGDVYSYHKEELNERIQRAAAIFRRLKIRFFIHRWYQNAVTKRITREQKEEKILQNLLNFPVATDGHRSAGEMLDQLRGKASPSIRLSKFSLSTTSILDKRNKAESVVTGFRRGFLDTRMEDIPLQNQNGTHLMLTNGTEDIKQRIKRRRTFSTFEYMSQPHLNGNSSKSQSSSPSSSSTTSSSDIPRTASRSLVARYTPYKRRTMGHSSFSTSSFLSLSPPSKKMKSPAPPIPKSSFKDLDDQLRQCRQMFQQLKEQVKEEKESNQELGNHLYELSNNGFHPL